MSLSTALEAKFAAFKESCVSGYPLPELQIGNKRAAISIVQGGMGVGISLSKLASAVAREGGIGVIAANGIGMIEADYESDPEAANIRALRNEIRKARRNTTGLIGVNIMVAADCYHQLLDAAIEEKADILFCGAGLPIKGIPVEAIRRAGVQFVPIVSSARAARLIFKMWEKTYNDIPDGVVVEGPRAGGHLGFKLEQIDAPEYRLELIVPEVVEALKEYETRWNRSLPVIAAGGIFTGEDIYRFLKLGAKGVQMATRFVATNECDADIRFKEAYLACKQEDITIIHSPVGMPGRAINGRFLEAIARGEKKVFRCPSHCLASCGADKALYCISEVLDCARKGDLENGFVFCGANAYRVESIVSVKQLITGLRQSFALASLVGAGKAEIERRLEAIRALRDEYLAAKADIPQTAESSSETRGREEKVRVEKLCTELGIFLASISSLLPRG